MKNILLLIATFFAGQSLLQAQSFYDEGTIQDIEITFSQTNWDQILDQAYANTGDYTMALTVTKMEQFTIA